MVNLVLEEEDADLIGRGGEGCAGSASRAEEEEEEEDFFFFLSSLEPDERAFTDIYRQNPTLNTWCMIPMF